MRYGDTTISKKSKYITAVKANKITPYLQEKLIFIGQEMCYEDAAHIAEELLLIETNDTAIYRLTDKMGSKMEAIVESGEYHQIKKIDDKEVVYAQVDGSMLLTREDQWKEVKLGRVFVGSDLYELNSTRNWLRDSEYIAHLGNHVDFERKMGHLIDEYERHKERLIFINDGAIWIWNWISAEYPNATQILDFYHVMSHIAGCSKFAIKNAQKHKAWLSETSNILMTKGYEATLERIEQLPCSTKKRTEEREKLYRYFERNKERMDYPTYIENGWLIGSGAIESAHRTVLQHRLKKSGQRWSSKGLQNIIRLRVLNKSGHWDLVTNKIKLAA